MFKTPMIITLLGASLVAMLATETQASLSFGGGGFTTVPAQCQNGINDDPTQDGLIDYKNSSGVRQDPGCSGLTDNSEKSSTTTSTATMALSTTTQDVFSLNAIFPVECDYEGTGKDCPRDLECSAFGKQAKGGTKFDNELECTLANVSLGVRCINNGTKADEANFHSVFLTEAIISASGITNIDNKGKWSAVTTIFGSDLYHIAKHLTDDQGNLVFTDALCPNTQNWELNFSSATVLQADVTETTYQNEVPQNTLDLGTCVLIDYISGTYSCQ
jgi:hypothetical protein